MDVDGTFLQTLPDFLNGKPTSPDKSVHACSLSAACARSTLVRMRSVRLGTSVLPIVATEIVWRSGLKVTASRAGFSARTLTTERATQSVGSVSEISGSDGRLM